MNKALTLFSKAGIIYTMIMVGEGIMSNNIEELRVS